MVKELSRQVITLDQAQPSFRRRVMEIVESYQNGGTPTEVISVEKVLREADIDHLGTRKTTKYIAVCEQEKSFLIISATGSSEDSYSYGMPGTHVLDKATVDLIFEHSALFKTRRYLTQKKRRVKNRIDGNKLLCLRVNRGLNQSELAEGICSTPMISQIENNKAVPSVQLIEKLAHRLGVGIEELEPDSQDEES